MNGGSRKGQEKWNISSQTGSQRNSVVVVTNYRVRDSEACRCLYPAGIPARAWYSIPLCIKLDTEPPIMSSVIDLAQAMEGWRGHGRLSTPMYEKV